MVVSHPGLVKSNFLKIYTEIALGLFLVFLVCFYFYPAQSLLSQNASYHIRFADLLLDGDWSYKSIPFLESSIFSGQFVDQHFGFHALVAFCLLFFPSLWAIKVLTAASLGVGLLLLAKLFRQHSVWLVFSAFVIYLFSSGFSTARIFWERPQFLTLLAAVGCVFLLQRSQAKLVSLFLVGLSGSLVSFETLATLVIVAGAHFLVFRRFRAPAAIVAGAVSSLFVFPLGFAKLNYLVLLGTNNLLHETRILEWKNQVPWVSIDLVPVVFLIVMSVYWWWKGKSAERKTFFLYAVLAGIFFLLFHRAVRFGYLYYLFSLMALLEVISTPVRLRFLKVPAVATMFLLSLFLFTKQKSGVPAGDRSTQFDLRAFSEWYMTSPVYGSKVVNFKWEYWSPLFFQQPQIRSEPGFSMLAYKNRPELQRLYYLLRYQTQKADWKDWRAFFNELGSPLLLVDRRSNLPSVIHQKKLPFVRLYGDANVTLWKFIDVSQAFQEYERLKPRAIECLAGSECGDSFTRRIVSPTQIDLLHRVSEASQHIDSADLSRGVISYHSPATDRWTYAEKFLFQHGTEFLANSRKYWTYSFYKTPKGDWVLADKNLIEPSAAEFLENLEAFYARQLKKGSGLFKGQRVRKILGLMSVCQFKGLQAECKRLLDSAEFRYSETWDLGSLSLIGLIYRDSNLAQKELHLKEISRMVLGFYDPILGIWRRGPDAKAEPLRGREYVFAVGEALTFLASRHDSGDLPWLRAEIGQYLKSYMKSRDIYHLRWLLSALYYFWELNPRHRAWVMSSFSGVVKAIDRSHLYKESFPIDFRGCFISSQEGVTIFNYDHHSGLILEGLSYFARVPETLAASPEMETYRNALDGLLKCTLRQQIHRLNYTKVGASADDVGAIRLEPRDPQIRIDVLGHLGIGVHQVVHGALRH
jgi:hypothetical protein